MRLARPVVKRQFLTRLLPGLVPLRTELGERVAIRQFVFRGKRLTVRFEWPTGGRTVSKARSVQQFRRAGAIWRNGDRIDEERRPRQLGTDASEMKAIAAGASRASICTMR